jgi:hypothetical protein
MMKDCGIRRTYKLMKHYGQQFVRTRSFERWYADEHARDIAFHCRLHGGQFDANQV